MASKKEVVAALVAKAARRVEMLKKKGWTKGDFAREMGKMLGKR